LNDLAINSLRWRRFITTVISRVLGLWTFTCIVFSLYIGVLWFCGAACELLFVLNKGAHFADSAFISIQVYTTRETHKAELGWLRSMENRISGVSGFEI
jgi:hypothetical protein